jgi:hypothetical protein
MTNSQAELANIDAMQQNNQGVLCEFRQEKFINQSMAIISRNKSGCLE